jgi:hypothetical protein
MALGRRSPRRTTLPHDSAFRKRPRCTGCHDRFRAGRRQPFRYAADQPMTGKVRVARHTPRNPKSGKFSARSVR